MRRLTHRALASFALAGFFSNAVALNILLVNDDGFEAPGIKAVHEALTAAGHSVTMVAPRLDQSGSSAKISTGEMAFAQAAPNVWVVDGSPADASLVGLDLVFKDAPPDLVVSGANRGQNIGSTSNVSGTVGAAIVAAARGIPALAISVGIDFAQAKEGFPSTLAAYPAAGKFVADFIGQVMPPDAKSRLLPPGTVININYPVNPVARGARWAAVAPDAGYAMKYVALAEPGRIKLSFGPDPLTHDPETETDTALFAHGYVTLSVLKANWEALDAEALIKKLGTPPALK